MNCDLCDAPMSGPRSCRECDGDRAYIVHRFYANRPGRSRVIKRNLTYRQAREWCHDPETSSTTATSRAARARTRRMGEWFDGYTSR